MINGVGSFTRRGKSEMFVIDREGRLLAGKRGK
jgi:hypothetical protein